ncbi:dipeptidase [candidate division KSB1 bacterium]|nr:dipeptidase [candidate division KSB1 bacterium]
MKLNHLRPFLFLCLVVIFSSCSKNLKDEADKIAQSTIILDGHVDIPYRLNNKMEDISQRTEGGDFDFVRAKKGGLNAPFMSIYIPAEKEEEGTAKKFADYLIDMVEKIAADSPDKFAVATSVADVHSQFEKGVISLPMGMENGAPIEGDLKNVEYFYNRGIRYITLTHSKNNHICDSSYDPEKKWNGLSPFGNEVVKEMNRVGIMIDVSHITDDTFYQVMEITQAPVIASHSSCRAFTPGFMRNMDDEMLKKLAENGGVIQINFGSSFLDGEIQKKYDEAFAASAEYAKENNLNADDPKLDEFMSKYKEEHNIGFADITDIVKHIDHVVNLIGIDHVGIGSDFDGVGDSLPTGMKDVSMYPNLIHELLKKGYSREDIVKICSGNVFRVWSEVEATAKRLQTSS